MNRRGFLSLLGSAAVGLVVAPVLPFVPAAPVVRKPTTSTRYIQHYDAQTDQFVSRLDVLYGVAPLRPTYQCRVLA